MSLRPTCERNWTWFFLTTRLHHDSSMGTVATVVYKRWLQKSMRSCTVKLGSDVHVRRLDFSILCSAIVCLHGSRSSRHHPEHHHISGGTIDLAYSLGRVPLQEWASYPLYTDSLVFMSFFSWKLMFQVLLYCIALLVCEIIIRGSPVTSQISQWL